MKKFLIFITLLCTGNLLQAQPWFHTNNGTAPKLDDIVKAYDKHPLQDEDEEEETHNNGKVVKEGRNYQFERWYWYWKNHTDADGYLVSPIKTFNEWNAYQDRIKSMGRISRTTSLPSNWTFQGPDHSDGGYHGLGRINTVAFHPFDANTFWIGSAGGGVWKTTDSGSTWTSVSGNLPVLGISDIDFNPVNPNTVYVCTGDGDGGDTYSLGVFKSTDGGATWNTTGLNWNSSNFYNANSLIINRADTNSLFLASSQGIYRSFDGGATWDNVHTGNFKQILYDPIDTNIIYAATYDPANIYRTADGGNTWTAITNNGANSIDRIALAVTPSAPNMVRAVFANYQFGLEGIYSSSDTGQTFTKIFDGTTTCLHNILSTDLTLTGSSCSGQAWYDLCIAIRPDNSDMIVVGGVNTWQSTDGGATWHMVTQWYEGLQNMPTVHADKHFLGFNPLTPNILFEGCDGGIHTTADEFNWVDITNGLGITQFYRNAVSNDASFVLGGAQDNGSKLVVAPVSAELTGGDGMQCQIDCQDSNVIYTASQYGSISASYDGGINFVNISNNIPNQPQGSWVTPYVLQPQNSQTIIAGYDQVYVSYDQGASWSSRSPTFSNNNTIDRVALSYTNVNYIYVLVDNHVHYSTDFGTTWHAVSTPYGGTISDIVVDPKNENILWVTFSGYTTAKVVKYTSNTNSWSSANGQLPNIPVNCIIIDTATQTQYIGTDAAVFYRDTTMTDWTLFNTNLPNVVINDLNINYTKNQLWAATFGRGMWKTQKADTARYDAVRIVNNIANTITISPNPGDGHFRIHTTDKSLIDKTATMKLLATNARTVWSGTGTFSSSGDISINAANVDRGIYMLQIVTGKTVTRSRVVILKE